MATFKPKKAAPETNLKRTVVLHATLAYPSFTEPDEQSGKYATLAIIDPNDPTFAELEELVRDHSIDLCGEETLPARFHNPLRDGDERKDANTFTFKNDAFRGKAVVRLKSAFQPACFAGEDRHSIEVSEIRGGDEVLVEVTAFNFSNQSSGVALSLGAVWKVADGKTRIEKGAASGGSFGGVDVSKFKFRSEAPQSSGIDFE
jgi:hypothetical protein